MIERFNIRVYGLTFYKGAVLVTDEKRNGHEFTKFPGGGLKPGEGIVECLYREFEEETGQQVKSHELFYITDFFQRSAFNPKDQLISIYYRVRLPEPARLPVKEQPFDFKDHNKDFKDHNKDQLNLRWIDQRDLETGQFEFPVDRIVVEKIISGS